MGLWAGRAESRGARGLILAGRNVPLAVGFCTMTATWVGGGYLVGTAEAVFDPARGLLWAQAPWGYAASLLLGGLFFARPMRRRGFTTMLDPFEQRYGARVAVLLFVPALVGEIFWSAAILTALGTAFGTILGVDVGVAIVVSAAIAIGYTILGGLRSVAYTDVLQLVFVAVGLGVALPFILDAAGGLDVTLATYTERFADAARLIPAPSEIFSTDGLGGQGWLWLDLALLLICGGIPWQVYFQRVLSCRNERQAVSMSVTAAFGCLVLATPAVLIGMAGATADWAAVGASAPETAALVLPQALRDLTPPLVASIGLGALAAAVMSSIDSSILSGASMFTWNVWRPLRPAASDRETRLAMRLAIAAVGALATLLALRVQSVYTLWALCADLVFVVLFPQLVMALWLRTANRTGALAGIAVGLLLRLGGGEPLLGLPAFLPYPMTGDDGVVLFPFRTTAMLSSAVVIVLVSFATRRRDPARQLEAAEG